MNEKERLFWGVQASTKRYATGMSAEGSDERVLMWVEKGWMVIPIVIGTQPRLKTLQAFYLKRHKQ